MVLGIRITWECMCMFVKCLRHYLSVFVLTFFASLTKVYMCFINIPLGDNF